MTDPLCSWCWGMSTAIDAARGALGERVRFDLLPGGINVGAEAPLGAVGRARLAQLWREVEVVTGQRFAQAPSPAPFVYNSTRLCAILEAVRLVDDAPPFAALERMQRRFFAAGDDVTSSYALHEILAGLGHDAIEIVRIADSDRIRAHTRAQFALARSCGTHALPNVVLDDGARRLLAGGYLDGPTLIATIETALRSEGL